MLSTILLALVLGTWGTAAAQVELRFSPPDTTIQPLSAMRMSVMIDEDIEIRTIDINVTYDTTIVASLGGGAGRIYTDSGLFTFQGFEEDTPGHWHGYAVIMGAGLFVAGPGELFYWDLAGLQEGVSAITAVEIYLAATDGSWYEDVALPPTTVTVDDPLSAVQSPPGLQPIPRLSPNPFNPRTEFSCDLTDAGWTRLAVFDLGGRRVATLHEGLAPAGRFSRSWNGRDASGRSQPGGVYFFRLETSHGIRSTKGILLK